MLGDAGQGHAGVCQALFNSVGVQRSLPQRVSLNKALDPSGRGNVEHEGLGAGDKTMYLKKSSMVSRAHLWGPVTFTSHVIVLADE